MRKSSNLHVLGFSSLEECGLWASDSDGFFMIIPKSHVLGFSSLEECGLWASDSDGFFMIIPGCRALSAVRSVRSDADNINEEMACCDTNAAICAAVVGCMMTLKGTHRNSLVKGHVVCEWGGTDGYRA